MPRAATWESVRSLISALSLIHIYLARLVERLPEKQREIVLLRFAQDLTLRETADVLGLPLRTVQSRLRAALKYLKKILKEGGETDAK